MLMILFSVFTVYNMFRYKTVIVYLPYSQGKLGNEAIVFEVMYSGYFLVMSMF